MGIGPETDPFAQPGGTVNLPQNDGGDGNGSVGKGVAGQFRDARPVGASNGGTADASVLDKAPETPAEAAAERLLRHIVGGSDHTVDPADVFASDRRPGTIDRLDDDGTPSGPNGDFGFSEGDAAALVPAGASLTEEPDESGEHDFGSGALDEGPALVGFAQELPNPELATKHEAWQEAEDDLSAAPEPASGGDAASGAAMEPPPDPPDPDDDVDV